MHGGEHKPYTNGRGFAEPEPEQSPEDAWAAQHAGMTADYERRVAEHNREAVGWEQSEERRERWEHAQRRQQMSTGSMGYKGFWRGRPELTGTPAYAGNWLMLDRPAIHEGFGPLGHDPIGSMVERRAGGQALAGRREALEAEGGWLGEVTEYPGEEAVKSMFPSGLLPQGSQFRGVVFGD